MNLTNSIYLFLSYNNIVDLNSLSNLLTNKMYRLEITCIKIADLRALIRLKNLQYLDLSSNRIVDLSPLSDLYYNYIYFNHLDSIYILSCLEI